MAVLLQISHQEIKKGNTARMIQAMEVRWNRLEKVRWNWLDFFLYVQVMVCAWVFVCDVFFFSHSVFACPAFLGESKEGSPPRPCGYALGWCWRGHLPHAPCWQCLLQESSADKMLCKSSTKKWLSRYYCYWCLYNLYTFWHGNNLGSIQHVDKHRWTWLIK